MFTSQIVSEHGQDFSNISRLIIVRDLDPNLAICLNVWIILRKRHTPEYINLLQLF